MGDIKELTEKVRKFRKERDWEQFHNPKDTALSIVLEAAELLEHFQWKSEEEIKEYVESHREEIGEELVDVLWYSLLLASDLEIDFPEAFEKKRQQNEKKYPVEKAKGRNTKYTEL